MCNEKRWIFENILKHYVPIFTWRKTVVYQLETDGKYINMETLVNVLNSLRLYSGWPEATWGLTSISFSISLSIPPSAAIPEPCLFIFLFHFPESKCCWVGQEPRVEVEQAGKLIRSLCREEVIPVQHRGTWRTRPGMGIAADECVPTFLQQHLTIISLYQKESHSLSPSSSKYLQKAQSQSRYGTLHSKKINY